MADPAHARRTAQRFVRLLAGNGTTSALVFGSHFPDAQEALFEEAEAAGLRIASGLVVSDRNLRPELEVTPEQAYRAEPRPARPLARPRPPALRGHAALLRVLHEPDARGLPRAARRGRPPRCSRATSTSRPARSSSSSSSSRTPRTTSAPTRTPGCCASARCSPTTSTSPTTSSAARRGEDRGRALPVVERVPVQRDLRDGPPRRARRALRDGHRRRRRHGPEHAQGGPRRLPRADGPRAGPHARPGAPALPGDGGRRARARARRPHRRPDARQGGRPAPAAAARRAARSRPCSRTRRPGRPRSARSSRSPARSRSSRSASPATSCSAAKRLYASTK